MKYRKTLLTGVAAAAAILAAAAVTGDRLQAAEPVNKEQVQEIVRDYLKQNPVAVIEAIETYQANRAEYDRVRFKDTIDAHKAEIFDAGLPFAGNPDGDVLIAEFFDYNCGYCKRAMDDIQKVLEADKNVKFVFHEMPILSESSELAARYAFAAHKQGKYFEYHRALMQFTGSKTEETLESIAKDTGLDVEKLRADAGSDAVRAEVSKSMALARKLGINGTPAFIIADMLAPGYLTHDAILDMVRQARDAKKG